MNIIFRRVRAEDLKDIERLEKEIFGVDAFPYEYLFYLYHYSDFFIVASTDSEIVGYLIGELSNRRAHILTISVREEYRRRGIGSRLLELFIEYSRNKADKIYLEVSVNNKEAIKFYRKHGFKEVDYIANYYRDGSDAYVMEREI